MTQEQKRILIAEACGWKRHYNTDMQWRYDGDGPDDWVVEDDLPDYFNDLNAMHEAEKVLNIPVHMQKHAWNNYKATLETMTKGNSFHATAAQRAEAFLRTIGKWTE